MRAANPALCMHIPAPPARSLGEPLSTKLSSPVIRPTESSALAAPLPIPTLQLSRTAMPAWTVPLRAAATGKESSLLLTSLPSLRAALLCCLLALTWEQLPHTRHQFCGCCNGRASLAPVTGKSRHGILRQDGVKELPGDNIARWYLGQSRII